MNPEECFFVNGDTKAHKKFVRNFYRKHKVKAMARTVVLAIVLIVGFTIIAIPALGYILFNWSINRLGLINQKVMVKVYRKYSDVKLPQYQTDGAACMDVHAYLPKMGKILANPTIHGSGGTIIETGLIVEIPKGYKIGFKGKSGLGFKNAVVSFDGTIDCDYRGELKILLFNHSNKPFEVNHQDRVCQIELVKIEQIEWQEVKSETELSQTDRGQGGFGSTGQK